MSFEHKNEGGLLYLDTELNLFFRNLRQALAQALDSGDCADWFEVIDKIKRYEGELELNYGDNVELIKLISLAKREERDHQEYLKNYRAANEAPPPIMDDALKSTLQDFYLHLGAALKGSWEAYEVLMVSIDILEQSIENERDEASGELSTQGFYLKRILERSERALEQAQDQGILIIPRQEESFVAGQLLQLVKAHQVLPTPIHLGLRDGILTVIKPL